MSDVVAARKPTPMTALRRHVVVSLVLVLACTVVAFYVGKERPRVYTAEARLAVSGRGLTSDNVASFPLASSELAADYARYVNNAQEQRNLEETLKVEVGSIKDVTASPIPDSNVVRIEVTAAEPGIAVQAAQNIADGLVTTINDTTAHDELTATTLQQYTDVSNQLATAQQASAAAQLALDTARGRASSGFPRAGDDLNALQAAAAAAAAQVQLLTVQADALGQKYQNLVSTVGTPATLQVIQPAARQGDDFVATAGRFTLAGLAAGILLALGVATLLERRRAHRQAAGGKQAAPTTAEPATGQPAGKPAAQPAAAEAGAEPAEDQRVLEDARGGRR
ncbi:hypothetical protein [Geodermatophilus sp. SYSU D00815]